jgi:hypothetical protein
MSTAARAAGASGRRRASSTEIAGQVAHVGRSGSRDSGERRLAALGRLAGDVRLGGGGAEADAAGVVAEGDDDVLDGDDGAEGDRVRRVSGIGSTRAWAETIIVGLG